MQHTQDAKLLTKAGTKSLSTGYQKRTSDTTQNTTLISRLVTLCSIQRTCFAAPLIKHT
jgi:hypothetical protein